MPRAGYAALALVAALLAPVAHAERDLAAQANCLAKQLRKHSGPEGGRASAMKAHFACFPDDPASFAALFDTGSPLAADLDAQLALFFAARGAVAEREWSAKAVAVLAGGEWRVGAVDLYASLLALQLKARAPPILDAAGRLDDAALASFWRALFGSATGFKPDPASCIGRKSHRACVALAALAPG